MTFKEFLGAAVFLSLIATEIALVVSINRAVREIRGIRKDLPGILFTALGGMLLVEASRRFFPGQKDDKQ